VPDAITAGVSHNREILLDVCVNINPKSTLKLMSNSRGELSWKTPSLHQLFNAVTNYRNKMGKGIISSFKEYDQASQMFRSISMEIMYFVHFLIFPSFALIGRE
jgi:hypothetical protein